MKTFFTKKIDLKLSTGRFSEEHKNWLFTKKEALNILDQLIENNFFIL